MPTTKNSIQPQIKFHETVPVLLCSSPAFALGSLASPEAASKPNDIDPCIPGSGFHRLALFHQGCPAIFSTGERDHRPRIRDHLTNSTVEAVIEWPASPRIRSCATNDLRSTNFLCRRQIRP